MADQDNHTQMALQHLDDGLLFAESAILFFRHNRVNDGDKNKAVAQKHYGMAQEYLNQANPTAGDRAQIQERTAKLETLLKLLPEPFP
jgi:hypothetical protein